LNTLELFNYLIKESHIYFSFFITVTKDDNNKNSDDGQDSINIKAPNGKVNEQCNKFSSDAPEDKSKGTCN